MFWNGWDWGAWVAMALMMVVMLAVVLLAVWIIARPFSQWAESKRAPDAALEDLRRRYARGEIDAEEYEDRRRRLTKPA